MRGQGPVQELPVDGDVLGVARETGEVQEQGAESRVQDLRDLSRRGHARQEETEVAWERMDGF